MRDFSGNHSAIALNTATLGHNLDGHGAGWPISKIIDACAERDFGAIAFWRREIGTNGHEIGNQVRSAGLEVCGLCRTPFLVGPFAAKAHQSLMDDFYFSIEQAADLGTDVLTIVVGGVIEQSHSMRESLLRVASIVEQALPRARDAGVRLALEPLNPVYGGNRSCLVSVRDAVDLCEQINDPFVTIAIDVYHVWWDLHLAEQLQRAGKQRIVSYHLCDWLADTTDILLDRGMMGDGVADLRSIRQAVEAVGYDGYCEVEIFSASNWWKRDPDEVLDTIVERFKSVC